MQKGKLYLIPVTLGNNDLKQTMPHQVFDVINNIEHYIVENIKSAAKFLKQAGINKPLQELSFNVINAGTNRNDIIEYLEPSTAGNNIGMLSEAGVPCVADPGSNLVSLAHERGIKVIPLTGPSSIILALMASGFNGQNFTFNGYLPIEKEGRKQKLKELEKKAISLNETQIFIEAPHRNDKLLNEIMISCRENLRLCIAKNLTMHDEFIKTQTVLEWKKLKIELGKNPVIYLFGR